VKENSIYSYHTFLFPFRWDCCNKNNIRDLSKINYKDRVDIKKFYDALTSNKDWSYDKFEINDNKDYNEYVYFYEYVRDAIYNIEGFEKDHTTYYFKYKKYLPQDGGYFYYNIYIRRCIKDYSACKKEGTCEPEWKEDVYQLMVDEISMKVYDTGVAILQFSLENNKYYEPEDILIINEFGRRIYPQFLGEFENKFEARRGVNAPKGLFYADRIAIEKNSANSKHKNVSTYYDKAMNLHISRNSSPVELPEFISKILGKRFKTRLDQGESRLKRGDVLINPIIDDRMFVICWYGNDYFSSELKTYNEKHERLAYTKNDFWQRFLFVDGFDKGNDSRIMEKELLEKHTYIRWIGKGVLFGVSRYSFMLLTDKSDFAYEVLLPHIKTIYYQIVILALAQRASILKFSDEVALISSLKREVSEEIPRLHENYIKFVNKVYFREVTAQEQGIELYNMVLDHMRVREDIKDLDNEISELHSYADLIEEKRTNKFLKFLAIIGALFLIPAYITGFFGMNIFPPNFFKFYTGEGFLIEWIQKSNIETYIYATIFALPIICVFLVLIIGFKKNH